MVKTEQIRPTNSANSSKGIRSMVSTMPLTAYSSVFQATSNTSSQNFIDMHTIDISSVKGRFAWEKIAHGDTYVPVIFRGSAKFFCVKMLRKLLAEYPEDIIRRSSNYHYRKPIALYVATPNEIVLLNRINSQHCNWAFSQNPLTISDELVRVTDFLQFYEYLRVTTTTKLSSVSQPTSATSSKSIILPIKQTIKQSSTFNSNVTDSLRAHSDNPAMTTSTLLNRYSASESSRHEHTPLISKTIEPISSLPYPPRLTKLDTPSMALPRQIPQHNASTGPQQQQQPLLPLPSPQQTVISSNIIITSTNTELPNKSATASVLKSSSQASSSIVSIDSLTSHPVSSSPTVASSQRPSTISSEKQLTPTFRRSSSSSLSTPALKPSRLNAGWLQINKLYTPYISSDLSNHHLYKIPISLLTFYDLIKIPSADNNTNVSSQDLPTAFEQTSVTPEEIELINDLCLKQNIKPFSIDTKLIDLLAFYKYCSTSILFVKELPLNEPKAFICKEWSSVVQINGGICRLRNLTTLHEQTVPFIGTNLLKNFIISSPFLSSASLTTPTPSEIEFLQLILFFSNTSINLQNAKLIDIESVRKEYTVDLILLFNDKFPLNVLNYQHQTKTSSTSQGQSVQSDSSAATNTFAESTPPPSPISPTANMTSVTSTYQLPLTSVTSNRYQKQIMFHGHSMTAYICSGLNSQAQRECVSIQALCNMLYPNSSILDKLEMRMLRLLRMKDINRFRPQNQQSINLTRLVDINDVEKHWDYIEKGMHSLSNNNEETRLLNNVSSLVNNSSKASKVNRIENNSNDFQQETSVEVNQNDKRTLEATVEEEKHIFKRIFTRGETLGDNHDNNNNNNNNNNNTEKSNTIITNPTKDNEQPKIETTVENNDKDENHENLKISSTKIVRQLNGQTNKKKVILQRNERTPSESSSPSRKPIAPIKKKIKLVRKRRTPSMRLSKQSIASWIEKYNIEDFCIRLDFYKPTAATTIY